MTARCWTLLVSLHNRLSSLVTPVVEYHCKHHTVISSQSATWFDKILVCKWLKTGSDPTDTRRFRFFVLSELFLTPNKTRSSWTGNTACGWARTSRTMNRFAPGFQCICGVKGERCERLGKQSRQRFPFIVNMDGVATHTLCLHGIDSTISWNLSLFSSGQVSSHRGV